MKLYVGIDLHATNNYIAIVDQNGAKIYQRRLINELETIARILNTYKKNIQGVVVESTYNWYWLVDGLMELGYRLHLANPSAIKQYSGIKHTDDKSDALWLAKLLQLNLLAEGYIYPKEERCIRDLLRKRSILVQHQTSCVLSIQSMIMRHTGINVSAQKIKKITDDEIKNYFKDENSILAITTQHNVLQCLMKQIDVIEKSVLSKIKKRKEFGNLTSIPGVGNILTLTIMLETGDISRFKNAGHYVSYCRCVSSKKLSNGKTKGRNNCKNGNKYLCWAFVEAANFAIRYNHTIKKYYQKKMAKTNKIVALKTIAHKLAKAGYFIIKDGIKFDETKAF